MRLDPVLRLTSTGLQNKGRLRFGQVEPFAVVEHLVMLHMKCVPIISEINWSS